MKQRTRWLGAAAALALVLLIPGAVAGYAGEVAGSIVISAGSTACNRPLSVSATVLDSQGKPISGQRVAWGFTGTAVAGDSISPGSSTTNSTGVAQATVKLACTPDTRTLRATADQVSGTAVLTPLLSGVLGTTGLPGLPGLPQTSTAPPTAQDASSVPPGVLLVAGLLMAVMAAGSVAVAVRRVGLVRR